MFDEVTDAGHEVSARTVCITPALSEALVCPGFDGVRNEWILMPR